MTKYSRLNEKCRMRIDSLLEAGFRVSEISKKLNVHRSTIYRELKRNSDSRGYCWFRADRKSEERYKSCRRKRKISGKARKYIETKLSAGWSPEQIAGRIKYKKKDFQVSHETIYRFIHYNRFKEEGELYKLLLKKRTRRLRFKRPKDLVFNHPPHLNPIDQRPKSANNRSRFGHWERDLMLFARTKSKNLLVLVDRKSRYVRIQKLPSKRQNYVIKYTRKLLRSRKLPVKTITNDRGSEFKHHKKYNFKSRNFIAPIYSCDAYNPRQRGTVENTIGVIRRYLPKGTEYKSVTHKDIKKIETALNNRPRKCLGYRTPVEVMFGR